ncbi:MAG: tetratricopeptide repeat protein, partial [Myxococcales bacterium]|nr:tetratricopeptide repeat protein [Myxococcales bacterium]
HGAVLGRVGSPDEAEAVLRRAMLTAATAGDDAREAEVAVQLLRSLMFRQEPVRVAAAADFVRAALVRAGGDVHEVDGIEGEARLSAGDAAGAIEALQRALTSEHREDRIAILETTLGSAHLAQGDHQAALRLYAQALQRALAFYGAAHPSVGFFLHRLGRGQREAGQLGAAHQTLSEALELRRAALGPEDRAVASTLLDLALTELAQGEPEAAAERLLQALEIRERAYGRAHVRLAEVLLPLGDAQAALGQAARARASYARARALREASTPDHPQRRELDERLRRLDERLRLLGSPATVEPAAPAPTGAPALP